MTIALPELEKAAPNVDEREVEELWLAEAQERCLERLLAAPAFTGRNGSAIRPFA